MPLVTPTDEEVVYADEITPELIAARCLVDFPDDVRDTIRRILKAIEPTPGNDDPPEGSTALLREQMQDLVCLVSRDQIPDDDFARRMFAALIRQRRLRQDGEGK
ncbi:MAG: hypothetical protein Q8P99_01330 [bacterium]|nr:hypothetical protein [bacterium]